MNRHSKSATLAATVFALALASASQAEDFNGSVSIGYDQSTGKYGTDQTTDIRFVPITVKIENNHWTYKATIPWLEVEGGSLIADGEVVPGATGSASGLGDINLSVAYLFYPKTKEGAFFEVAGKVKVPTADEADGLGTGETDYTATFSVFQPVDQALLFADLGYRVRGSSDLYDFQDGFIASAGLSWKFTDRVTGGVMYSFRESATGTSDDPADVMPYVTLKSRGGWSLNAYGTFGQSDSSPDNGFGISLKQKFK